MTEQVTTDDSSIDSAASALSAASDNLSNARLSAMSNNTMTHCADHCDFERAKLVSRATWVCPDCGRDISVEYLYWAPAAHPEWFEPELTKPVVPCTHNQQCKDEKNAGRED